MKKIYTYLVLPVLLALGVAACSEDTPAVPSFELEKSALNVEAAGGTVNLNFQSTFPWTASSDENWCSLTTKKGEGGNITLPLEIRPNEEFESRTANITLRSEDLLCKVQVIQAAHGAVTLVVKHTLQNFSIPMFEGKNISGTIQWGDGSQDDYSADLSHDFAEQKEYTTSFVVKGVETVTLNNITGITEMDFTNF